MTKVAITKEQESDSLPVFRELAKTVDDVRNRAFQLFEARGRAFGGELDDWFAAERELCGWPEADLQEKDGAFELEVSLPGFAPKEVEVNATPSEIVVHAATVLRSEGKDASVVRSEFGSDEVYRRFSFPDGIDTGKIVAELDNGLLRVKAPKSVPAAKATKNIPVATS